MSNSPAPTGQKRTAYAHIGLRLYLTLAVPVLLTLLFVRLVMTPAFLHFEYHRADFPPDFYGFSTQDRLEYAPYALDYLLNDAGIGYLSQLRLPPHLCQGDTPLTETDCAMYNPRELDHMEDVKTVTQAAFVVGALAALLAAAAAGLLWRRPRSRSVLRQGIMAGSALTLMLIAAIVAFAALAWNRFFDTFHALLFEQGTWRFAYSDTLIRLFPERFWFDAALAIGGLAALSALLLLALTWYWGRRARQFDL